MKLHKNLKKPAGKEGRNDQPIYQLRKLKLRVTGESPAQSHTAGRQEKGGRLPSDILVLNAVFLLLHSVWGGCVWDEGAEDKVGGGRGEAHPGTAVEGINGVRKDSRS